MKSQEVEALLFKEFTDVLVKYNVPFQVAHDLTMTFGSRWYFLPERVLEPMKEFLHSIPPSKFIEREEDIKQVYLRAIEDLRLLVG